MIDLDLALPHAHIDPPYNHVCRRCGSRAITVHKDGSDIIVGCLDCMKAIPHPDPYRAFELMLIEVTPGAKYPIDHSLIWLAEEAAKKAGLTPIKKEVVDSIQYFYNLFEQEIEINGLMLETAYALSATYDDEMPKLVELDKRISPDLDVALQHMTEVYKDMTLTLPSKGELIHLYIRHLIRLLRKETQNAIS